MNQHPTGDRSDQQLIAAIRDTITAGRERGDGSSAILGQIESLLAGVEVFLEAASGEHIAAVSTCNVCTRPIEYLAGIKDPYWRHAGNASYAGPHAARPVGDVADAPPRGVEDGAGVAKPVGVEGHGHRRGEAWATEPSGEQPVVLEFLTFEPKDDGRRWWVLRGPTCAVSLTAIPAPPLPLSGTVRDREGVELLPDCYTVHRPGDHQCFALPGGCDNRGGALLGARKTLVEWALGSNDDAVIRAGLQAVYEREIGGAR